MQSGFVGISISYRNIKNINRSMQEKKFDFGARGAVYCPTEKPLSAARAVILFTMSEVLVS
jgi:hypothetical protein